MTQVTLWVLIVRQVGKGLTEVHCNELMHKTMQKVFILKLVYCIQVKGAVNYRLHVVSSIQFMITT